MNEIQKTQEVNLFSNGEEVEEEIGSTSPMDDFWKEFENTTDVGTFVWLAGLVVEVEGKPSRAFITARSKIIAIDKIYQIITSPEVDPDLAKNFTTKTSAIKEYFDGKDNRDIFLMLCPLE